MLVNILNPEGGACSSSPSCRNSSIRRASVPALQILCLGLWFDFAGTLVNIVIALAAAGAAGRLRHVAWLGKAARWFAATLMGALAVQLALSARRQA